MVFTRSQFNKEPHKYETRLQTNREEMKKEYAETMKLLFKVHDTIKENNNIRKGYYLRNKSKNIKISV